MKSRPVILRLLKQRALPPRPILRPQFLANSSQPISTAIRPLSTTCRLLNETKKEDTKGKEPPKKKATVEDNAPPQSPWKVFINTLKEEIEKNQGWQDNVKQLQGDASKVVDSEAMKRARILYEKARISNMIKENPRIAAAAKTLSDTGVSMSDATARALQDAGVIAALEQLTNFGRRFTQPLKDSVVGQAIIEALDDIGMEGYEDKEVRRERRRKRLAKAGGSKKMRANPEAGEAVVLSSDSEPSTSRLSFLSQSPAYQRFKENYYESDEPLYNALRMVGSKFGRLVQENEHARVIVCTRQIDPDFRFDKFQVELKEYIVPEVIDAFLSADQPDMRSWMSEAAYNVSWAQIGEYVKRGLVSSCRVQEIGSVDIHKAMFVNDTIPVFLVACEVQEINAWKSAKTGKVMIGAEDVIQRTRYAMALTMVEAELDNELTGGWKISEFVRREM